MIFKEELCLIVCVSTVDWGVIFAYSFRFEDSQMRFGKTLDGARHQLTSIDCPPALNAIRYRTEIVRVMFVAWETDSLHPSISALGVSGRLCLISYDWN